MRSSRAAVGERRLKRREQALHLRDGSAEHHLDRLLARERFEQVRDPAQPVGSTLQVVADEAHGTRARLHDQPSLAADPAVDDRLEAARPALADRARGHLARERAAAHDLAVLHDQSAVVHDERQPRGQLRGHLPRRGVAPPGHQHDAHAALARAGDRLARAGRERAVAAQERAVDVERDEPDARRSHAGYSPVQTVTRSIASPGRIRSTTSIPATTWPKCV